MSTKAVGLLSTQPITATISASCLKWLPVQAPSDSDIIKAVKEIVPALSGDWRGSHSALPAPVQVLHL